MTYHRTFLPVPMPDNQTDALEWVFAPMPMSIKAAWAVAGWTAIVATCFVGVAVFGGAMIEHDLYRPRRRLLEYIRKYGLPEPERSNYGGGLNIYRLGSGLLYDWYGAGERKWSIHFDGPRDHECVCSFRFGIIDCMVYNAVLRELEARR